MARKKQTASKPDDPSQSIRAEQGTTVPQPAGLLSDAPEGYAELLETLKERIRSSQVKATLAVNRELITLYWETGKAIVQRQRQQGGKVGRQSPCRRPALIQRAMRSYWRRSRSGFARPRSR
jgi:hypothetical protein